MSRPKMKSFGIHDRVMPGMSKSLKRRPSELSANSDSVCGTIPKDADRLLAQFIASGRMTKCKPFTPRSSGMQWDSDMPCSMDGRINPKPRQ